MIVPLLSSVWLFLACVGCVARGSPSCRCRLTIPFAVNVTNAVWHRIPTADAVAVYVVCGMHMIPDVDSCRCCAPNAVHVPHLTRHAFAVDVARFTPYERDAGPSLLSTSVDYPSIASGMYCSLALIVISVANTLPPIAVVVAVIAAAAIVPHRLAAITTTAMLRLLLLCQRVPSVWRCRTPINAACAVNAVVFTRWDVVACTAL